MSANNFERTADAPSGNWVERFAPTPMRDYLILTRADRPVGTWLLMWPCWWSLGLATSDMGRAEASLINLWYLILFALGAFILRGAGCIVNDLVDRKFDPLVERTAGRPIASGAVSVNRALLFLTFQGVLGLVILLQFNTSTVLLGLASIPLIALYPFAKRFTNWPQLLLGLTFNWGALMGWSALLGGVPQTPALILYASCVAWTVGYDTVYAHQDKQDDIKVGIKSSALALGDRTRPFLVFAYGFSLMGLAFAGHWANLGVYFYYGLGIVGLHFAWQIFQLDIDDQAHCLRIFKSNAGLGGIVFISILAGFIR